VQQTPLTDKDLSDVHQDVTALDNHPLDGQTFANVLRLANLGRSQSGSIIKN
jgi:hypothetical protein